MAGGDWQAERWEAVASHHARLQAHKDAEHQRADKLLKDFVHVAAARGPVPVPLRVRGYNARRSARTRLQGWYLRTDGRAGVDTDGNFYLLIQRLSFLDTFRTLTLQPSRPPLILGAGGRDGESISLECALEQILPGWDAEIS